uniref:Uncharacterized protein n=1 Tax=Cannabis sativa TaxID=3483 RepID=A0A803Q3J8_CANSA
MGSVHYFLGFEVLRDSTAIYLNRSKYIQDLLVKTNMLGANSQPTPMCTTAKLSLNSGTPLADPSQYRNVIGALQYLLMTRPDIAFAVNKLSQYLKAPTTDHWGACKRILRYLFGTTNLGLTFTAFTHFNLQGYSDADWAGCSDDRKSTTGYCMYLRNNLVSWCSKKQSVIARSSTESEYRALALAASEMVWLESILNELSIPTATTPILWCDNLGAGSLTSNPVYHARTKHIEIDVHFVRNRVLDKKLDVRYVDSTYQIADLLTKPLHNPQFNYLRVKLTLKPNECNLRGDVRDSLD